MMFFFLKSCLSFILLCQSLPQKLLPPWMSEMRLVSVWLWKKLSILSASWLTESGFMCVICEIPTLMPLKKKGLNLKIENVEEDMEKSILDLPELALESILGRLSPSELCNMASVCSSLRDRCRSDHLWKRHMKAKWGRVVGPASYREWQWHLSQRKELGLLKGTKKKDLVRSISCIWPFYRIPSKFDNGSKPKTSLPVDSLMALYLSLESGKFWFPAQVYNREHGHVGFMLSCYDAELSYDSHTDTFHARYPPHGKRVLVPEEGVRWDRLRAPLVDTPPHNLHVSDCLNDLCPGDNIEIQWRRNEEFPYGWWYGVVGHLESCDGNENQCHCHNSDTVILEFNQYTPGSRWRRTAINRKDHREEGNDADGFYGGIRKLYNTEEISMWKRLWPTEVLE